MQLSLCFLVSDWTTTPPLRLFMPLISGHNCFSLTYFINGAKVTLTAWTRPCVQLTLCLYLCPFQGTWRTVFCFYRTPKFASVGTSPWGYVSRGISWSICVGFCVRNVSPSLNVSTSLYPAPICIIVFPRSFLLIRQRDPRHPKHLNQKKRKSTNRVEVEGRWIVKWRPDQWEWEKEGGGDGGEYDSAASHTCRKGTAESTLLYNYLLLILRLPFLTSVLLCCRCFPFPLCGVYFYPRLCCPMTAWLTPGWGSTAHKGTVT